MCICAKSIQSLRFFPPPHHLSFHLVSLPPPWMYIKNKENGGRLGPTFAHEFCRQRRRKFPYPPLGRTEAFPGIGLGSIYRTVTASLATSDRLKSISQRDLYSMRVVSLVCFTLCSFLTLPALRPSLCSSSRHELYSWPESIVGLLEELMLSSWWYHVIVELSFLVFINGYDPLHFFNLVYVVTYEKIVAMFTTDSLILECLKPLLFCTIQPGNRYAFYELQLSGTEYVLHFYNFHYEIIIMKCGLVSMP